MAHSSQKTPEIPREVAALTSAFLEAADSVLPGVIQGLYLTGSAALGDFRSHVSDVDFVAVSACRLREAQLEGLATVHAGLRRRYPTPDFDGTHLSWADLEADPGACPSAPFSYQGRFEASGNFALNPVTWHELEGHGLAVRGPSLEGVEIWCDSAALKAWTRNNLTEYWRPWVARYRERDLDVAHEDELVCWGVLGVARMHYTLMTGRITSKSGAGRYALDTFGLRSQRILSEAVRLRADPMAPSGYPDLSRRRVDVVAFMELALDAALDAGAAGATSLDQRGKTSR
jgi:Domain of unknown function (DUF4111)